MNKQTLNQVKVFAINKLKQSTDHYHSHQHINSVARNALLLSKKLNANINKNLLLAICYLHDIHSANHKPALKTFLFEKKLIKKTLPQILKKLNLSNTNANIIKTAVYNHPQAFPFKKLNKKNDLYSQVLQDADLIDQFSLHPTPKPTTIFQKLLFSMSSFLSFSIRQKIIKFYSNNPQPALEVFNQVNVK